jgi:hypothetical protein
MRMADKQDALVIVKPTAARPTTRNHASVGDSSPAGRIELLAAGAAVGALPLTEHSNWPLALHSYKSASVHFAFEDVLRESE